MTFELTVTMQLQAETLGAAVVEVEDRIRNRAGDTGRQMIRLSAMTGKLVTEKKESNT